MKQILSLFLFLIPCLAWAQYTSNGNQKITLGEQTTADGLIYRGVLGDTALITPLSDTSAYIILDTANHRFYNYNRATNVWSVAGGGTAVTSITGGTGLTGGTITTSGTLAADTSFLFTQTDTTTVKYVNTYGTQTINGGKTISGVTIFSNTTDAGNAASAPVTFLGGVGIAKNLRVGGSIVADGPDKSLATLNGGDMQFYNTGNNQFGRILSIAGSGGNIRFQANGSTNVLDLGSTGLATIYNLAGSGSRGVNADANGSLSAASSILIKENVKNINYGLSDVLKLKPVIFNYIDKNKWGEGKDLGFVAEDVMNVIPEATGVMNNSDIYFDLQKLVPVLTKAIQEQQAQIEALKQRLLILENK